MKNLNKILITLFTLPCLIFNLASAETDDSDCWRFGILSYEQESDNGFYIVNQVRETEKNKFTNFLTIEEQKAIITKNDLNTAILNLKKHCCNNELWWLKQNSEPCKNDKPFFNDNSLDSPYLFNHIFDVIMRRLSWLSGEQYIYTKTNMTLDNTWAIRRWLINNRATSSEWTNPQIIISKYKQFRKQSPVESWYNISSEIYNEFKNVNKSEQDFLQYIGWNFGNWESKTIVNALKNYNNRTLYDKYINSCALTEYFYTLLWPSPDDKNKIINAIPTCKVKVEERIIWESNYVSLVVQRSASLFLANNIQWYTDYLSDRQLRFLDLRTNTKNRWLDVIRAVPCLQRKCVK